MRQPIGSSSSDVFITPPFTSIPLTSRHRLPSPIMLLNFLSRAGPEPNPLTYPSSSQLFTAPSQSRHTNTKKRRMDMPETPTPIPTASITRLDRLGHVRNKTPPSTLQSTQESIGQIPTGATSSSQIHPPIEPLPDFSIHKEWQKGDFSLIAKDRVIFRVWAKDVINAK